VREDRGDGNDGRRGGGRGGGREAEAVQWWQVGAEAAVTGSEIIEAEGEAVVAEASRAVQVV
jgi:hypothetical protein